MTTIHERLSCTTCESYIAEDCRCMNGDLLWPRCDLYIPDIDRVLVELGCTLDQRDELVDACEWMLGTMLSGNPLTFGPAIIWGQTALANVKRNEETR